MYFLLNSFGYLVSKADVQKLCVMLATALTQPESEQTKLFYSKFSNLFSSFIHSIQMIWTKASRQHQLQYCRTSKLVKFTPVLLLSNSLVYNLVCSFRYVFVDTNIKPSLHNTFLIHSLEQKRRRYTITISVTVIHLYNILICQIVTSDILSHIYLNYSLFNAVFPYSISTCQHRFDIQFKLTGVCVWDASCAVPEVLPNTRQTNQRMSMCRKFVMMKLLL